MQAQMLDTLLTLQGPAGSMLKRLEGMAKTYGAIADAVTNFGARLAAMKDQGIDADQLTFAVSHGRSSMEYYDGFVFGFTCEARPDLPPIATGGRYDALTRQLGRGREIPAVGGVIRPGLVCALRGQGGEA